MAKRQNRLAPIQHEIRQLIALKSLEPNATPADARLLSERLIDVAVAALIEVEALENGEPVAVGRLSSLLQLTERAMGLAQGEGKE